MCKCQRTGSLTSLPFPMLYSELFDKNLVVYVTQEPLCMKVSDTHANDICSLAQWAWPTHAHAGDSGDFTGMGYAPSICSTLDPSY